MESKQTGRVILILIVLAAAIFAICPQPWRLGRAPLSDVLNLKPGIDMVGGTSLLYQIEAPDGGYRGDGTLAAAEVAALKKRIDPQGVKNYIWRPVGEDRIEIQIPASAKNDQATAARDAYIAAGRALEATNVSSAEVMSAVQAAAGPDLAKLDELAAGVPARKALFAKMVADQQTILTARKQMREDMTEANATHDLEELKKQIDAINLPTQKLENSLSTTPEIRTADLAKYKADAADYPARLKAIDEFVRAYDAYHAFKGGVDDAGQLKRDLQGAGLLEFHIAAVDRNGLTPKLFADMAAQLQKDGPREHPGQDLSWFQLERPEEFNGEEKPVEFDGKKYILCWTDPKHSMTNGAGLPEWQMENVQRHQELDGEENLQFRFDAVGGKVFGDFTGRNVHQPLASILDRKVITVADISEPITGGSGRISGRYTDDDLSYMVTTMSAGSLPARLREEPISENTVGPQLGADNLRRGLIACGFGLVIVALFLIVYYYRAGVVATVAVVMNVVLILGVLAAFGATFTLPGIAGIVLTIGAAVDANVLIFERLREEQQKDKGLGLRKAMQNAYDHARSAILDSNFTTVITSIILYALGSEEVKGFGLTLLIGLISSLFTSLFVTRTIFNIMIDTFQVKKLGSFPATFPKWDKLLKPDINWMKYVPYFVTFSAIFILAGASAIVVKARSHELADVDFTSGTQVQFDLREPMSRDQVEDLFTKADNAAVPAPYVTAIGTGSTSYELVTANPDSKAVREAVMSVMGPRITSDLPSKFDHVGDDYKDQYKKLLDAGVVQPISTLPYLYRDVPVKPAENYLGGVAVTLTHINPPLKPDQIRDRLDRQRATDQAAATSGTVLPPHDIYVWSPNGTGQPTSTAIIFSADPSFTYGTGETEKAQWIAKVADPVWRLVTSGINKEGTLQKVNTFGPQVAGDNQLSAIMTLILSSVMIMAFIWFRFGNLKYGTATVLAMIHDVALVIGAIGLSHWAAQYTPWLAHALLIEPFRVNLTIVAAVLTVMSYSMIDTIVVFDRIRENRGKFGHLSRKIVNDSINQTLSRTLLTAGTTLATIAGMYIVGGPGIHGFTFVLLVGILVGTYSSIAIAAPILLFGADAKVKSGQEPPVTALQRVPA